MARAMGDSQADRFNELVMPVVDAALGAPGDTDVALRRAALDAAASLAGRAPSDDELPSDLGAFVDKVARNAYKVTDGDVRALLESGYSQDAVYEVIVSAAVGAGLARLERGLTVVGEAEHRREQPA